MANDLTLTNLQRSLSLNSLSSLVQEATDLPMLLIDCSSSMGLGMPDGMRRIDALRQVVDSIRGQVQVTMIAFGGETTEPRFVDRVPSEGGGTPMHLAIPLAAKYGASRLVIVSDGEPDLCQQTIEEVKTFGGRVDVVFVGTPGSGGELFLDELAKMTGGTRFTGSLEDQKLIAGKVTLLLCGEVEPERAPIQGEGFSAVESDGDTEEEDDEDEDADDDGDEDDDEADDE